MTDCNCADMPDVRKCLFSKPYKCHIIMFLIVFISKNVNSDAKIIIPTHRESYCTRNICHNSCNDFFFNTSCTPNYCIYTSPMTQHTSPWIMMTNVYIQINLQFSAELRLLLTLPSDCSLLLQHFTNSTKVPYFSPDQQHTHTNKDTLSH